MILPPRPVSIDANYPYPPAAHMARERPDASAEAASETETYAVSFSESGGEAGCCDVVAWLLESLARGLRRLGRRQRDA